MPKPRSLTRMELMQAATLIQNRKVMPRKVTAEDVVNRGPILESPITGVRNPRSAQEVEGMTDGVQRAKRAEKTGSAS